MIKCSYVSIKESIPKFSMPYTMYCVSLPVFTWRCYGPIIQSVAKPTSSARKTQHVQRLLSLTEMMPIHRLQNVLVSAVAVYECVRFVKLRCFHLQLIEFVVASFVTRIHVHMYRNNHVYTEKGSGIRNFAPPQRWWRRKPVVMSLVYFALNAKANFCVLKRPMSVELHYISYKANWATTEQVPSDDNWRTIWGSFKKWPFAVYLLYDLMLNEVTCSRTFGMCGRSISRL